LRVRKVVNRVYEGKMYYRWLLSIPPQQIGDLGWVDGQELETSVRGNGLWIRPSPRARPGRRPKAPKDLAEPITRRTLSRPGRH
jgi:hypothetical protein